MLSTSFSDGVPVNLVQAVMGREQASTTLNRYTHTPVVYDQRVLAAFETSSTTAEAVPLSEPMDTRRIPM